MPENGNVPADADCVSPPVKFLLKTIQELSLARTLDHVQRLVSHAARELTGCDGASFVLQDCGYCYYIDEDAISPLWKGQRFLMENCISGWAMHHRTPAVIEDIYGDARIPRDIYRQTFVKSLVVVPIRTLDPIGAIGNYWSHPHQASAREVELLQSLADSVSIVMENLNVYQELEARVRMRTEELEQAVQQIRRLSITDDLTGLYNRRGFHLMGEQVLRRLRRSRESFLIAFFDVDGLKQVNDHHGHRMGDQLIKDMAALLRETLRESDIVARVGGDEFCVLAQGVNGDSEELRQRLQAQLHQFNGKTEKPYQLSFSMGIVKSPTSRIPNIEALMEAADERMYEDKYNRRRSTV